MLEPLARVGLSTSLCPLCLPPICHAPWFTRDPRHSGHCEALHLKCLRAFALVFWFLVLHFSSPHLRLRLLVLFGVFVPGLRPPSLTCRLLSGWCPYVKRLVWLLPPCKSPPAPLCAGSSIAQGPNRGFRECLRWCPGPQDARCRVSNHVGVRVRPRRCSRCGKRWCRSLRELRLERRPMRLRLPCGRATPGTRRRRQCGAVRCARSRE